MQLKFIRALLIILLANVSLSGCLTVDDFGDYWDKASIDADIVGIWVSDDSDNKTIIIGKEQDYLVYINKETGKRRDDTQIKTLRVADKRLLLLRGKKLQAIFYYTIDDDSFRIYGLKREEKNQFAQYKAILGDNTYIKPPTLHVKSLNEEVILGVVKSIDEGLWRVIKKLDKGFAESKPLYDIRDATLPNVKDVIQ